MAQKMILNRLLYQQTDDDGLNDDDGYVRPPVRDVEDSEAFGNALERTLDKFESIMDSMEQKIDQWFE